MQIWWEALTQFQQVMFVIAVPATLILIIFLIMMIIGIDGTDAFGGDVDIDVSGVDSINDEPFADISGLRILSVRGALTFLSIGAWMGFVLDNYMATWLAGILGLLSGGLSAFLLALAFKASLKLENEGNINYQNAIGKIGVVYLRIPASRSGKGKVNVTVQGRFVEVEAITDDEEIITTGANVEIVDLLNDTTIIVRRARQ
ncbi:MAG: hypothetical protein WC006_00450 [Bacilli bacterium]|nr:hypothetical protein [Bacilli bacterium]